MGDRVQYLTVQTGKRVFLDLHSENVIRFKNMVYGVEKYDMSKLMIIGVSCKDFPIHYRQYFKVDHEVNLESFLMDAWLIKYGSPFDNRKFGGQPEKLIIDFNLKDFLPNGLLGWLESNGIKYEFLKKNNRKFSSTVRYHQEYPKLNGISHTPVKAEDYANDEYLLTIENLNKEMSKCKQVFPKTKAVKKMFDSDLWLYKEPTVEPCENDKSLTIRKDETEIFLNKTSNDVEIFNPFWVKSSGHGDQFQYGYMENNYQQAAVDFDMGDKESVLRIAIQCTEKLWKNCDKSTVVKLNNFKKTGWRNFKGFSEIDCAELLKMTGVEPIGRDNTFVYEFSRLRENNLIELWKHVYAKYALTYEVICKDVAIPYKIYVCVSNGNTHIFLAKRRYKKWLMFAQGECYGFNTTAIFGINHCDFEDMINRYEDGDVQAFSNIRNMITDLHEAAV